MKQVAVLGESLIDLIQVENNQFKSIVGGSPFNVARALGKQNIPVNYLSPLSNDHLGNQLSEALIESNVNVVSKVRSKYPTSLAVVTVDDKGQPSYSLYRQQVADRDISLEQIIANLPENLAIFHTGSLTLIPNELGKTIKVIEHIKAKSNQSLICIDLNIRSLAVNNIKSYAKAIEQVIPQVDLVKLSDEDLLSLPYSDNPNIAIEEIFEKVHKGVVIITLGAKGCILKTPNITIEVAPKAVTHIADTIGSGDCFQAGMIAYLYDHHVNDLLNMDKTQWIECLNRATSTAAYNIQHYGCTPPALSDLLVN